MADDRRVTIETLICEEDVKARVRELVAEVARDCGGDQLVVIGLLKGSFVFVADFVRLLHGHEVPVLIDFMRVSSYGSGTESSGTVRVVDDITTEITDETVLLVDDILDTGRTLREVRTYLEGKSPRAVRTCVLLDKPSRRVVDITADYVGFTVADHFVVGYGLDYDDRYRELPHVCRVSFEE